MPRSGRPKAVLVLTDAERDQLRSWSRRRSSAQALALRSRIALGCAEGFDNKQVAAPEQVSQVTVGSGVGGSWSYGSTDCLMIHGRVGRRRSLPSRSSR